MEQASYGAQSYEEKIVNFNFLKKVKAKAKVYKMNFNSKSYKPIFQNTNYFDRAQSTGGDG